MTAEIVRPQFGARPRPISDNPISRAINDLASIETENMAWLRRAGPVAARLVEESRFDGDAA